MSKIPLPIPIWGVTLTIINTPSTWKVPNQDSKSGNILSALLCESEQEILAQTALQSWPADQCPVRENRVLPVQTQGKRSSQSNLALGKKVVWELCFLGLLWLWIWSDARLAWSWAKSSRGLKAPLTWSLVMGYTKPWALLPGSTPAPHIWWLCLAGTCSPWDPMDSQRAGSPCEPEGPHTRWGVWGSCCDSPAPPGNCSGCKKQHKSCLRECLDRHPPQKASQIRQEFLSAAANPGVSTGWNMTRSPSLTGKVITIK